MKKDKTMIDPKEIPVLEPQSGIRFGSLSGTEGLYKHVNSHILSKRDEKWSQLFDADLIAEAKNCDYITFGKIPKNSAFHRLSIAYQSLVADTLSSLCEREIGHLHFYKEEHQDAKYQAIEAWDIETKIQIIAKSFVRNDEFRPYVLCSAYRPFPKISGKQVRKKVLERWTQETQSVFTGIVLVIHDKSDT